MPRRILALAAFLVALPIPGSASQIHDIVVDVGAGEIKCGDKTATEGCLLKVREEGVVSVRLKNALPGLFTNTVTTVLRPERALPAQLGIDFGLIKPKPAASPSAPPPAHVAGRPDDRAVIDLYNDLIASWQSFQRVIAGKYTADTYKNALTRLLNSREALLTALGAPDDGASVAAALNSRLKPPLPVETVAGTWDAVKHTLSVAPASTAELGPFLFTFDGREFDLLITVAPVAGITTAASRTLSAAVREKYGWKWAATTGFAFSGLRDENWSIRTIVVTPATDSTPAVTRNEAVEETKDKLSTEPAVFIHLSPIHNSFAERIAFTTGVSVNPTNSARIYAGVSWHLGRVGALTVGAVAGRVKLLAKNVDRADLGTLDPQQARRDVLTTAFFGAFSLRFGGQ